MTARADRLPRQAVWAGLAGTTLIHAAALIALLAGVAREQRAFPPSFAVELVAAPAATSTAPAAGRAATESPPVAKPIAKPAASRPTTRADQRSQTKTAAPVRPLPGETPGTGSDIANVKFPGKAFPYPEYLRNLVTQIYRRWNRPANNSPLTAEVGFIILRNGTVLDIRMVSGSRSFSFDQEALGAIEAAAQAKAFGPLPAGYEADYLQINFVFQPRQGGP